ncbi:hypothetical protein DYB32_006420 [Aphanomyces invadans]|uniref:Uncharacterized protein n=1 Tax=Aphanomyces invadans TaxID=157072 RepID=A0A418ARS3_9STRA|nr:hypothetical protein DYB32_006420 [Aphanomyces invadans]
MCEKDSLDVHLKTAHGTKILASIATSTTHDDISLQAQALRILSENAHVPNVADVWEMVAHSLVALVTSVSQHRPSLLADASTTGPFAGLGNASDDGLSFVHQVKLWYVLTNEAALFSTLAHVTTSITEVKVLFSASLPRLVCLEYVKYHETFDCHFNTVAFLVKLVDVLWPQRPAVDDVAAANSTSNRFSNLVLRLCLCKYKAVWSEMLRVLEHLVASTEFVQQLVLEPHLRGAIAHLSAKTNPDDVAKWATSLLDQVDAYEHQHLVNVIKLPKLEIDLSLSEAVAVATQLKTSGNRWFREGNFTAARAFYRLGLSTLTVSESYQATRPPSSPVPKISVGQPVKVQQGKKWLVGMVSDVNGGYADVMLDNGSEADNVPVHLVHILPVETPQIADLRLHLCMNSAKCLHALGSTQFAIDCLTYALAQAVPNHIPALYLRGVLAMATNNIPLAKADLQKAHQLVSKTKTHAAMVGDIRTAWSRLQLMVKHRKRADKRMIKEMVSYLNSINIE